MINYNITQTLLILQHLTTLEKDYVLFFLYDIIFLVIIMKYPSFLKDNSTIGITAPSDGIADLLKQKRLENAIKQLEGNGFQVIETNNVRKSEIGRSSNAETRAKELMSLITDNNTEAIICATGGDFLVEILPYLNFEEIAKNPKWIQGYSDPTGILFPITTKLDIATIYSNNICSFGMNPWHDSLQKNISILKGENITQTSFELYEKEYTTYITGLEPYHLNTKVEWKNLFKKEITLEGRMIGGCLDLLSELAGTPFDYVSSFQERYKEDGIIWFFDNCELTSEDLIRTFWKLESCGWFRYCKGVLLGRSATETSYYQVSFQDTLITALEHLHIPVIYDMDFGHISPRMTMINGGYAYITSKDGKGNVRFEYK